MRIVLDTNCLLSILSNVSPCRAVFDAYRSQRFELAVSTSILAEYEELLTARTTATIAQNVLELINRQPNTLLSTVYYQWGLITADYDDAKLLTVRWPLTWIISLQTIAILISFANTTFLLSRGYGWMLFCHCFFR